MKKKINKRSNREEDFFNLYSLVENESKDYKSEQNLFYHTLDPS